MSNTNKTTKRFHNLDRVDQVGRLIQTAIVAGLNLWVAWGLAAAIARSIAN